MPARSCQPALRRAFTLLEMILTVAIIAMVAALAAPMFTDDASLRLMGASAVIASDIELAQTMTLSYPQSPVIVKFDPADQEYWLAYAAAPDTPIARDPSGEPYLVQLGQGRASAAAGVTITLDDMAGNTIIFADSGGLSDFSVTPRIQLDLNGQSITLTIAPTTGSITETSGTIADAKGG